MASKSKGSSFEREVCKQLDLWWQGNNDDVVFWRSTTSGGRATVRAKQGKQTKGAHGDISAVNPIGQPFIDVLTIECKKGYSGASLGDILDKPEHMKRHRPFEEFVDQVITSHELSNSHSWMLIHQRQRRMLMTYIPFKFYKAVRCRVGKYRWHPRIRFLFDIQRDESIQTVDIVGIPFLGFLSWCDRGTIEAIAKEEIDVD